jgi:Predicted xylanase/chitin deacetylase
VPFLALFLLVTSVDSLDWKDYGVDSIIDTVLNHKHLGNGSIILCHNGAKYTAQALDRLIKGLKEKGYEFMKMSDLIYEGDCEINTEGRQLKPNGEDSTSTEIPLESSDPDGNAEN